MCIGVIFIFNFDFNEILQAISHSIMIFFLLIILTRIIGKKLLAQMTFFDFVTGITIGTIGGAYVTTEVRGLYVLIGPIILTILVYLTGVLTFKNITARKLIEGEPIIVIQNGKIYEKNMSKIRYNVDDLLMQLREKGVFDLTEVEFAVLEPHGQLSVQKRSQHIPLTPKDLGLSTKYKGLSTEIIRDGRIEHGNLQEMNLTHEWLFNELAKRSIQRIEEVYLAILATDGTLFIDTINDSNGHIQKVEDEDSLIQ
jgi:uncharacterized membrane protein YcaP (DUF421 family)